MVEMRGYIYTAHKYAFLQNWNGHYTGSVQKNRKLLHLVPIISAEVVLLITFPENCKSSHIY